MILRVIDWQKEKTMLFRRSHTEVAQSSQSVPSDTTEKKVYVGRKSNREKTFRIVAFHLPLDQNL